MSECLSVSHGSSNCDLRLHNLANPKHDDPVMTSLL